TTIACMLGVLKAGCVYVPVAPGSPAERVRKVLEACGSRVLLASGPTAPLVGELLTLLRPGPAVGWMGAGPPPGDHSRPALSLVPPELNVLPHKLAEFVRGCGLTQWFSVPSILTHLAKHDAVRPDDFPHLKRLLWCGEVLPTPALAYWMRRLPHARFTNLYG